MCPEGLGKIAVLVVHVDIKASVRIGPFHFGDGARQCYGFASGHAAFKAVVPRRDRARLASANRHDVEFMQHAHLVGDAASTAGVGFHETQPVCWDPAVPRFAARTPIKLGIMTRTRQCRTCS